MLLRDLHDLHGRLVRENLVLPEGFRRARVKLVVDLDASGEIRSVALPTDDRGRPLERVVPDFPRASQVASLLIVDKLGYVIGLPSAPGDRQRTRADAQRNAYVELLDACAAEVPPELAKRIDAVRAAVRDPEAFARELTRHSDVHLELRGSFEPAGEPIDSDLKHIKEQCQWLVDFTVEGRGFFPSVLHEDHDDLSECVVWWSKRVTEQSTGERFGFCQVTEKHGPLARLLPGIGELPGNTPRLVSCNFEAAERYGASQADGAAISVTAASRATQALKWLAGEARDRHRWNLDDLVLVWWCPDDLTLNPLHVLSRPDPAEVRHLLSSVLWSGRQNLGETSEFHLAALTVNTARVVVRADHTVTLDQLQERLRGWFTVLRPVQDAIPDAWLGLRELAASACPPGRNQAAQRTRVATDLVRHVLMGERLPLALRNQVVRRCTVGTRDRQGHRRHVTAAQAALLHAIARSHKENPMPGTQAELCGRLLAILEQTQQSALGTDLNRGVLASYGAASATPQLVFPRLLTRRNAHAQRLRRDKRGSLIFLDRQLEAVMADLAAAGGFPTQLSPAEKAQFALGYWHKRHDLRQPTRRPTDPDEAADETIDRINQEETDDDD